MFKGKCLLKGQDLFTDKHSMPVLHTFKYSVCAPVLRWVCTTERTKCEGGDSQNTFTVSCLLSSSMFHSAHQVIYFICSAFAMALLGVYSRQSVGLSRLSVPKSSTGSSSTSCAWADAFSDSSLWVFLLTRLFPAGSGCWICLPSLDELMCLTIDSSLKYLRGIRSTERTITPCCKSFLRLLSGSEQFNPDCFCSVASEPRWSETLPDAPDLRSHLSLINPLTHPVEPGLLALGIGLYLWRVILFF